jgi:hypothetical protein
MLQPTAILRLYMYVPLALGSGLTFLPPLAVPGAKRVYAVQLMECSWRLLEYKPGGRRQPMACLCLCIQDDISTLGR